MTTRDALEAALVATPDDVVLHSAYADLLLEQGDPRGEFIRLQLAAEDRNQPVSMLREFEQAAFELRQKHEREWLGDLWQFMQRPPSVRSVAEPMEPNVVVTWKRGWIDSVRIGDLSLPLVGALADNRLIGLLGGLSVRQNVTAEGEVGLYALERALVAFYNLRSFELGSSESCSLAGGFEIDDYFSWFGPRLETYRVFVDHVFASELFTGNFPNLHTVEITSNNSPLDLEGLANNSNLPKLRKLLIDRTDIPGPRSEPIDADREEYTQELFWALFQSKQLKILEELSFRLPDFGDAGLEELLASGFINRLKGLDLCRCNITDDGARMLAAHPHVRKLNYLHLDNNLLSPIGLQLLEEVDQPVSPNQMFGIAPPDIDLGGEV